MKNIIKEWFITVPWGNLALASWGNPKGEPILLVHGRQDSLSTFIPLLEYLPDHYHYVGIDFPGNGKSDPLPTGIMLSRFIFVVAIDYAVNHLKWKKFGYISHSMGGTGGLFYNAINPGKITKMVLFDPFMSLAHDFAEDTRMYHQLYKEYYDNYNKYNNDDRIYTKTKAVSAVMKARSLSQEQAELILERNLKPVGDDQYKLSWDRRFRILAPQLSNLEYYRKLFTMCQPPTLVINASDSMPENMKHDCIDLINSLKENSPNFFVVTMKGKHDVHITNACAVAEKVNWFLKRESVRSKL